MTVTTLAFFRLERTFLGILFFIKKYETEKLFNQFYFGLKMIVFGVCKSLLLWL